MAQQVLIIRKSELRALELLNNSPSKTLIRYHGGKWAPTGIGKGPNPGRYVGIRTLERLEEQGFVRIDRKKNAVHLIER